MKYGVLLFAFVVSVLVPASADAASFKTYANCKALNKQYPHGVAKKGYAKSASGLTGKPYVSTKLYELNKKSDRDKDGVACEK